ncbi:MAG: MoxR family ATPase [bacterium]|nr:MoxR family ATPase [bacterium]
MTTAVHTREGTENNNKQTWRANACKIKAVSTLVVFYFGVKQNAFCQGWGFIALEGVFCYVNRRVRLHYYIRKKPMDSDRNQFVREAEQLLTLVQSATGEIKRVIVGMDEVIHLLFVALLARGHAIAESTPGQAKTKLMKAMAAVSGLGYSRVQGTPGLTPDDIIGQYLPGRDDDVNRYRGGLQFFAGPIFNEVILYDELNRTSPKTQAAILQAMEEHCITTAYGEQMLLPNPFFVLATQNPQEIMQGTYPLTEANLDRFMVSVPLSYPTEEDEVQIVLQDDDEPFVEDLTSCLTKDTILRMRTLITHVFPSREFERMARFATRLCRATRPGSGVVMELGNNKGDMHALKDVVHSGVSTRAEKLLARAARAHAFLRGKRECTSLDVQAMAPSVLRHRITLMPRASHLGFTPERVIEELLRQVPEL